MNRSPSISKPTVQFAASVHGRKRRMKPWVKWVLLALAGLIVFALLATAYYYPKAQKAIASAKAAAETARQLPGDLSQQNFAKAKQRSEQLQSELAETNEAVDAMGGLRYWPLVGRQYRAVDDLVAVGTDSSNAVGSLVNFLSHIFEPFSKKGKVSLASISAEEKGQLLKGISERGDELKQAQENIHRAADALDRIPESGLLPPLRDAIVPLKQQFPLLTQALDQAIPATKVFPTILGYPTEQDYLFLLENNTELRPGGGFIGTYGLMKLRSGEIMSLRTDNVYNLDNAAEKLPKIEPPAAMKTYLKANAWYFRDSNWSPDFPSTAQQALFMYQRQGGSKNIDGVVAVTPTAISELLRLVGPIKVNGLEFNADNLVDKLQYEVEQAYVQKGLSDAERKDIIGDMTKQLVDKLLNLPLAQWKDLFLTMSQQMSRKQILLYMQDTGVQSILDQQGWAGSIDADTSGDYLMVVDANLASLKTDQVMERTYTYSVQPAGDTAEATLTIKYKNTGKFDWKTTRYNTYVRVYVPNGSELIEGKGMQLRERSNALGKIDTTTEVGKTVFGTFKSIEPGQEGELVLKYRLPKRVADQWAAQQYSLIWQKQPGMTTPAMNLEITSPDARPTLAEGLDNQAKLSKDTVQFSGPLTQDRAISIRY